MVNDDSNANDGTSSGPLVPRHKVLYCGACGMPIEYCEYSPDYETHCLPWLQKNYKSIYNDLTFVKKSICKSVSTTTSTENVEKSKNKVKPEKPWTTEERLVEFYMKYEPNKLDAIPGLLEKYVGKEDKLFLALTKKYGSEPLDPYFSDDEDDDDDDDESADGDNNPGGGDESDGENDDDEEDGEGGDDDDPKSKKKKRRGVAAKKAGEVQPVKVIIVKQAKKKKRCLTVVSGLDTVPGIKLKDVTKIFAKKFAGSSSIKDQNTIIVQGDHIIELAELIIDKFHVPESAVYLDMDDNGVLVSFR